MPKHDLFSVFLLNLNLTRAFAQRSLKIKFKTEPEKLKKRFYYKATYILLQENTMFFVPKPNQIVSYLFWRFGCDQTPLNKVLNVLDHFK